MDAWVHCVVFEVCSRCKTLDQLRCHCAWYIAGATRGALSGAEDIASLFVKLHSLIGIIPLELLSSPNTLTSHSQGSCEAISQANHLTGFSNFLEHAVP